MGPDSGWYCPMRRWELAEEGKSTHRARGHLCLSSCTPSQTRSEVGDPAATLADDPKRSVNRGGAARGSGLLGGRAGTDSPCGFGSGEAKG